MASISEEELDKRFTYHAPSETTRIIHDRMREFERDCAEVLNSFNPSREISLAFTKLEEMAFWVHAHIARNAPEAER